MKGNQKPSIEEGRIILW